MVSYVAVEGYRDYVDYVENVESDGTPTYFYFYGTRMSNGVSWCNDCAYVEPIIRSYLRELQEYIICVFVGVGYRNDWTNMSCPFRNDNRLKLTAIPTIIKYGTSQRLQGSQCTNREFLDMIFNKETFDGHKARGKSSSNEIIRSRESRRQNNDPETPTREHSRRRVRSLDDYHPYYDPSENRQQQDQHHSNQRHDIDPNYKNNKEDPQHSNLAQQTKLARRPDSQQSTEDYAQQSTTQYQDNYSRYRERPRYERSRRTHSF